MRVQFAALIDLDVTPDSLGPRDRAVSVTAVCRDLKISRQTYYRWLAELQAKGLEGFLRPTSRRPAQSPGQVPPDIEDEIVRLRKELTDQGWDAGALSIHQRLSQAPHDPFATVVLPWVPSRATIHRVLRRRGLVVDAPEKCPHAAMIRFQYPDPNGCWQMDGTEWQLADGTKVCILKVIDDCSRAVMALRAALSENLEDAWQCVLSAIERNGLPARMLTDRGSALNGHPERQSQFRDRLRARGIRPISSRGYHPQTCGKTERSHQTLQQWLRRRPPATTLNDLQRLLDEFIDAFNNDRPHQALDGRTPASCYQSKPKATPLGDPSSRELPVITQVLVSGRGEVGTGTYRIQVGRCWAGARVTVLRDDLNVVITYQQELIRRLVIDPSVSYQGNGRPQPRGPKPHTRRVSPNS